MYRVGQGTSDLLELHNWLSLSGGDERAVVGWFGGEPSGDGADVVVRLEV